jgi:ABC-2 type transport system permease protein
MNAFIALVRKDLVLYFSNRRALLMSIAAPILIAAFFGSLFGNSDSKPAHINVAVTDLDRSELSGRVVAALRGEATFDVTEVGEADALAQVKAGKVAAAITVPAGFGKLAGSAMFGGTKPELVVHYDPSQAMALQVVRGLMAQHVMQTVSQSLMSASSPLLSDLRDRTLQSTSLPDQRRLELTQMFDSIAKVQSTSMPASAAPKAAAFTLPYVTREEPASARPETKYNSYSHSFAGMGVQFVLLMGVDLGVGLLLMRRMGLWKRLRAAPLSRGKLLGSRIASCALIALVVFAIVYAAAMAAFGVRIDGSVPGFIAVLVAFALLTGSFGLLIAAIGRTPEATRGLAILATLLMVMLGGAWVPSFIFPEWLQKLSLFVPTRWAVDGLDAMTWRGLPFHDALLPVAVMLGFAAVFTSLAIWRFDWEE